MPPSKKRPAAAGEGGGLAKRPAGAARPKRSPHCGGLGLCVAGEALIDLLPRETKDGDKAFLPKAGGSPFNACIAARRAGLAVHFFGGLSTDMFGQDLYTQLEKEGVDLSLVERVPRPTTLAFVSRSANGDAKYAFFKENSADRCLTAALAAKAVKGQGFGAVHMSLGAVTLDDVQMAEAFSRLFSAARSAGAFTSFDPNVRPVMISAGVEDYRAKLEEFVSLVDVAKASDDDVEFLYQGYTHEQVAETWLDLGATLVVITRGPEGAIAYYRPAAETLASVSARPPTQPPKTIDADGRPADVVDTVGAGDTLTGNLLFGLLGGKGSKPLTAQLSNSEPWDTAATDRLKEILHAAVAAAAINCSRPGCDPPTAEEVAGALAAVSSA